MFKNTFNIPASKNLRYFWFVFFVYFAFQFITAVIANNLSANSYTKGFKFDSLMEEFLIAVIIAPIFETFIFQYLVIETLLNSKVKPIVCVAISASLFGASHWYNLVYVLVTTVVGLIFGFYYMALRHQNFANKLVLVGALHALSNTIAFVDNNFLALAKLIGL